MQPKHCLLHNWNLAGSSEHTSKAHFLLESIKICFKTFRVGCFAYRIFYSLFIHYPHVKSASGKNISVEYRFDRYVEIDLKTAKNDENTLSNLHRDLALLAKALR